MQVNELLCFQLNECDRAWGKLKAAAVLVTPLADCLQSGYNAYGFSVLLFSWVMEGGAQKGK